MIFQIPIDSFSSLKKKKIAMSEDEKKNRLQVQHRTAIFGAGVA